MREIIFNTSVPIPSKCKPLHLINYDSDTVCLRQLKDIPKKQKIDSLLFTGGHGDFRAGRPAELNELSSKTVDQLIAHIFNNQGKVDNILIDCCDGAGFVPTLKKLLDDKKGVIYANLNDGVEHFCHTMLSKQSTCGDKSIGDFYFENSIKALNAIEGLGVGGDYCAGVYLKKENTLYYYGTPKKGIVSYLREQDVKVVHLKDKKEYLRKLLASRTPLLPPSLQKPSINKTLGASDPLKQRYQQIRENAEKGLAANSCLLSDKDLIKFLQDDFKYHFPDKDKCDCRQYTKLFFPITDYLSKKGSSAIQILARAACQYKLGHENTDDVGIFANNITMELTIDFVKSHLTEKILNKQAKCSFDPKSETFKKELVKDAKLYLDSYESTLPDKIVDEVLSEIKNNLKSSTKGVAATPQSKTQPTSATPKTTSASANQKAVAGRSQYWWMRPIALATLAFAVMQWTPLLSYLTMSISMAPIVTAAIFGLSLVFEYCYSTLGNKETKADRAVPRYFINAANCSGLKYISTPRDKEFVNTRGLFYQLQVSQKVWVPDMTDEASPAIDLKTYKPASK